MSRVIGLAALAAAATACMDDLDPPWQLNHDRIIAVRAEPPGIAAGETSRIDALLGHKVQDQITSMTSVTSVTSVESPELATVTSPASLSDVLSNSDGTWTVTAPGEDRLAAARSELKLPDVAPVPLQISMSYAGRTLVATKTLTLGQPAANPALNGLVIGGQPIDASAPSADLPPVPKLDKYPLSIAASDVDFDVTWLTSCGTMHDFDLPVAYLKLEADDPCPDDGELGVVLRDAHGGVAWKIWPIHAK